MSNFASFRLTNKLSALPFNDPAVILVDSTQQWQEEM